ncbi:MAG: Tex family protein [Lactovum sp.]
MNIEKVLVEEFDVKKEYVDNIVTLLNEGNTIPFIARYRKEMTGSMDDQKLREFADRFSYLINFSEKLSQIKNSIEEQGQLTEDISKKLEQAKTLSELEDIYRPFRPKRRTRATIAKEKGLEPLSLLIFKQETTLDIEEEAKKYLDEQKELLAVDEVIKGACDIIAEAISDNANIRRHIRQYFENNALISSKKISEEEETVFESYADYSESIAKIPGHRILALNRGEKEKVLKVSVELEEEHLFQLLKRLIIRKNEKTKKYMTLAIEDSYKRLIQPSMEREIRNSLTEKAEDGAIKVFGKNLFQLIMQQPIKESVVLAIDPGFRTGCKICVVDDTGKVLDTGVIYPTAPKNDVVSAHKKLRDWIERYHVSLVCLGNGTASRETEKVLVDLLKEMDNGLPYCIVNEAGASVYSASKLAAEEFPDFDVALRSAVSLARRIQDPMAELVKIDPKSIGVGQYQHDMNKKKLDETLSGVVEDCVNAVGVDVNTASWSLLSYVAGINSTVAKNIQIYREENGKISSRKELLKVKKLGAKAFEQSAGFIRVRESSNPLDNSGIHPESYKTAEKILKSLGYSLDSFKNKELELDLKYIDTKSLSEELEVGEPTIIDIIKELIKPARDPRDEMPQNILKSDVLDIKDLKEGMELMGTVRNIVDFGAFVDIGVHHDGLVHISKITDKKFIKHPLEVVSVGDIVKVKVIEFEVKTGKIGLSMIL